MCVCSYSCAVGVVAVLWVQYRSCFCSCRSIVGVSPWRVCSHCGLVEGFAVAFMKLQLCSCRCVVVVFWNCSCVATGL